MSFRTRLIVLLLAAEAVVLALLVWQSQTVELQRFDREFTTRLAQTRLTLGSVVRAPMHAGHFAAVQATIRDMLHPSGLQYIAVKDAAGHVIAASGVDPSALPRLDSTLEGAFEDRRYDTVFPVTLEGQVIGALQVGLSLDRAVQGLDRSLRADIFRSATAFLVSLFLFLAVIQPFARRLGRLQRAAQQIAKGRYDVDIDTRERDEVGKLALALKHMTEVVRARVLDLEGSRQELRAEQSRLLSLLSAMSYGVTFVDCDWRILYSNPGFARAWAIRHPKTFVGMHLFEALALGDQVAIQQGEFSIRLAQLLADRRGSAVLESSLASGRILKLQVCPVLGDADEFLGSVVIHEDITQARKSQSQLAFFADHDPLTGLFNRRRFEQELADRIEAAGRGQRRLALFFFDLDEFKSVNDLFGHRMGDEVLVQVAGEIRSQLRRGEFFARIGGDEFALLVDDAGDHEISALADRLLGLIGKLSVTVNQVRLSLTTSIGIAISPDHSRDAQELTANADAAMYQAKDSGKNTWRVYEADHAATLHQRRLVTWNDRIRNALRHGGFELRLQGVFDANDGERRYSEALLRMLDEGTGRVLSPGEFIQYAEKSNLIVDVDRWTLKAVIDLLADDPRRDPIAVNLSGRSIGEMEIAEFIAGHLARTGVDASRLCLEITETTAIRDMHEARRFIDRLHAIGCKVALDDFGAGFATFSYIKQLPVDVLKIDGLFIRSLAASRENQVFVKAMLDIARGFGKLTVAESVEDNESLEMLRSFGVDMVQGYLLERPTAVPKFRLSVPEPARKQATSGDVDRRGASRRDDRYARAAAAD